MPKSASALDDRKVITTTLNTKDIYIARIRRDALEDADNLFWASLVSEPADQAQARYEAAQRRAKALGFSFKRLDQLVSDAPIGELAARVLALEGKTGARLSADADAVLGAAPVPVLSLSKAYKLFIEKVATQELSGKSKSQIEQYKKVKLRTVNNFIKIVGGASR